MQLRQELRLLVDCSGGCLLAKTFGVTVELPCSGRRVACKVVAPVLSVLKACSEFTRCGEQRVACEGFLSCRPVTL